MPRIKTADMHLRLTPAEKENLTAREYFKKFISIFIQVAAQTLFMAISLAVCSGHFNTPAVPIDGLSGLAVGLIKVSPNILIAIAFK